MYSVVITPGCKKDLKKIDPYIVQDNELFSLLGFNYDNKKFLGFDDDDKSFPSLAEIEIDKDPTSKNGFYWSEEQGKQLELYDLISVDVYVSLGKFHPIDLLFPING